MKKVPKPKSKKKPHPRSRVPARASSRASSSASPRASKRRAKAVPKVAPAPPSGDKWWYVKPDQQAAFLNALANGATHKQALEEAGLQWRVVSIFMTHDSTFAELHKEAKRLRDELINVMREESADDRAINGWVDRTYDKDGNVTSERRYFSDRLMELRLKAANPGKYADRHEHTGADGGPIAVAQLVGGPARPASIAEWEKQVKEAKGNGNG